MVSPTWAFVLIFPFFPNKCGSNLLNTTSDAPLGHGRTPKKFLIVSYFEGAK